MFDNAPIGNDFALRAGEICFIEQRETSLSALAYAAIAEADIVLYDRALAPVVASALSAAGRYAEPVAETDGDDGPAIPPRALRLAADGWRVVHLLQGRPGWRRRLRGAAEGSALAGGKGDLPVRLVAADAGDPPRTATPLDLRQLDDAAAGNEKLTVILGPLATTGAAAACTFTANGLAG
jgi:hypothetical protein